LGAARFGGVIGQGLGLAEAGRLKARQEMDFMKGRIYCEQQIKALFFV
jgi:hypothetical protein